MVPPCAATMPGTTERPRPAPCPTSLVVKNGSKMRRRVASSMPQPLSAMARRTHAPPLPPVAASGAVAGSSETSITPISAPIAWLALVTRLTITWLSWPALATIGGTGEMRVSSRMVAGRLEPAALAAALGQRLRSELGEGEQRHHGIVEVMRHAAGERAHRLELLRVVELYLEQAALFLGALDLGDVGPQRHPPAVGRGREVDGEPAAIARAQDLVARGVDRLDSLLDVTLGRLPGRDGIEPILDAQGDQLLQGHADFGHARIGIGAVAPVDLAVAAVAQDQPLLGVEHAEALVDGVDRLEEAGVERLRSDQAAVEDEDGGGDGEEEAGEAERGNARVGHQQRGGEQDHNGGAERRSKVRTKECRDFPHQRRRHRGAAGQAGLAGGGWRCREVMSETVAPAH